MTAYQVSPLVLFVQCETAAERKGNISIKF